ncbi:MAG: hypothetical protein B7X34_09230 [Acidobacteriia bacterium 12-62-4]|nr:MAG: hypothetical protein B7X34_09230 [Acidobacteriia bacterium 12-62-4]
MRRILIPLLLAGSLWADEKMEAFGKKWSVPIAADWEYVDGILSLNVARPQTAPRRPKQFALLEDGPYDKVTVEVEARRLQGSLIIVYAYRDDAHFNYAHLSVDAPTKQPVHNGIFHVYGGDRVRISPEEGPGGLPDTNWHKVKLVWSGQTGEVTVTVDGQTTGALRGIDLSIKAGKIGLGSFFETAQFRNLKVINGS